MVKRIIAFLYAAALIFGITALADNTDIDITETATGLSVSFTAPEDGGIYVIGAEYSGQTLKKLSLTI